MERPHIASDAPPSDRSMQEVAKPAMAVGHGSRAAPQPAPGGVLPGAPPRGPHASKLAGKLDIRLSPDLREAVRAEAKRRGVTDGAYVRGIVADALGAEASADRSTAPRRREPSAALVALSTALRELGAVYGPLSRAPVDVAGAKAALGRARDALVPMIREEARDA